MKQSLKLIFLVLFITGVSCSKDSDSSGDGAVIVTVNTSNFSVSINENPTNGQVIGSVSGTTNQGSL